MMAGLYLNGTKVQKFNLQDDLNVQLVDFEINCADRPIQAHKIILTSRCAYFRNLITRDATLASAAFNNIHCDMMKKALEVIYGDTVRVAEERIEEFQRVLHFLRLDHWAKYDNFPEETSIFSPLESSDSSPSISSATDEGNRHAGDGASSSISLMQQ